MDSINGQYQADYKEVPSITDILCQLGIIENEYYNALSIAGDEYFQIHLKCDWSACFFNNYFTKEQKKDWKYWHLVSF